MLSTGQGLRTYGIVRALAGMGPVDLLYATFGAEKVAPEFATTGYRIAPGPSNAGIASAGAATPAPWPTGFPTASPEASRGSWQQLRAGLHRIRIAAASSPTDPSPEQPFANWPASER